MKFSERHGYSEVRTIAQVEEIDAPLRTGLWNTLYQTVFKYYNPELEEAQGPLRRMIWVDHLERPLDEFPRDGGAAFVKHLVIKGEWYAVYDLVEFVSLRAPDEIDEPFREAITMDLERYNAGYRLLSGELVPISTTVELDEITTAVEAAASTGAAAHLKKAVTLLSDRESPDYANSIKESISAVESVAREMTGAQTLGAALNKIAQSDVLDLHPAQIEAWKAMYKVTNDTPGIRHGGGSVATLDQAYARYFLVASSAFVNLLLAVQSTSQG